MKSLELLLCAILAFAGMLLLSQRMSRAPTPTPPKKPVVEKVQVLQTLPHDRSVFVQGLEFYEGYLFETGGLYGQSLLRKLNVTTGKEIKRVAIDSSLFAEGLTIFQDKIYVLTWREHVVLQYDLDFNPLPRFSITTEGWGLTHDSDQLIYSDGSDRLFFVSPLTFQVEKTLKVLERLQSGANKSISNLNELEYLGGFIYANIWMTSDIVIVDPVSGFVVKRLRCQSLVDKASKAGADVLNGIAFDADTNALYVTGKLWPTIHRIQNPM